MLSKLFKNSEVKLRGLIIKTLIFLFLITLLTWYSKQKRNNPFKPFKTTELRNTGTSIHLYFQKRYSDEKIENIASFLPLDRFDSLYTDFLKPSASVILENEKHLSTIPENSFNNRRILLLDILSDSLYNRLNILYDNRLKIFEPGKNSEIHANTTPVYSDNKQAFPSFEYSGIRLLSVSGIDTVYRIKESFREYFDILVMDSMKPVLLTKMYKQIRPIICIVQQPQPEDIEKIENIYLIKKNQSCILKKNTWGEIKILKQ